MKINELVKLVKHTILIIDGKQYDALDNKNIDLVSKRYSIKSYTYDIGNYLNIEIKK